MGGFINRFLFVEGLRHKTIPFPEPPDPEAARSLAEGLTIVVDRCVNSPLEMGWSGDARSMYDTFYRAWHERQFALPESTAAVTNRIPDHVVKIGMVYSVLAGEDQIIADTIATAIQIGEYLETTPSKLFSDTGLSKQGRVEQMIITRLRAHGGMMGLRELQQAIGGKTDAESFNRAITNLEKAEQIKVTSSKPKVYIGN